MEKRTDKDLEYLQAGRRHKDLNRLLTVCGALLVLGLILQRCG